MMIRLYEWLAAKLIVRAARLRASRSNGLEDAHELRHLWAAINAGNPDPCDGGRVCVLDCAPKLGWLVGVSCDVDVDGGWVTHPAGCSWELRQGDGSKIGLLAAISADDGLDRSTLADVLTEAHLRRDGHCGDTHYGEADFIIGRYNARAQGQ